MSGRLGNVELTAAPSVAAITRAHAAARGEVLRAVPVGTLSRSPWQPRTVVETGSDDFAGLVESIRARGVLEPLLARELPGSGALELLAGERRLEAAKAAGLAAVPVRVLVGLDDVAAREVALVENLARQDLTPWEEAQGLAALSDALEATGQGVTVRALAHLAGRSRSAVHRALRIARTCTPDVLALARTLPAGADGAALVPTWDNLPGSVLDTVSKGETAAERAALLVRLAAPYTPTTAAAPAIRRKPKAPPAPVTVRGDATAGGWSVTLRTPPADLSPADARAALDALEPVVRALRERLT